MSANAGFAYPTHSVRTYEPQTRSASTRVRPRVDGRTIPFVFGKRRGFLMRSAWAYSRTAGFWQRVNSRKPPEAACRSLSPFPTQAPAAAAPPAKHVLT